MNRRKIRLVNITMSGKWNRQPVTFTSKIVVAAETMGHLTKGSGKSRALREHFGKDKFFKNREKLMDQFKITGLEVITELGLSKPIYGEGNQFNKHE